MTLDDAIRHVRKQPRFRYRALTVRQRIGPYIAQRLIPTTTTVQIKAARKLASEGSIKIMWLDAKTIRSDQKCLYVNKLLWHLRHYAPLQRKKRPNVMMVRGIPVLWDGNHRVTSALLLGKRKIRCNVFLRLTRG